MAASKWGVNHSETHTHKPHIHNGLCLQRAVFKEAGEAAALTWFYGDGQGCTLRPMQKWGRCRTVWPEPVRVLQPGLPLFALVMYCTDPGEVEHSTRLISDPVLLVGTTIQYTCNLGFVLEGSSLLTCYSRETGTPIWTSRLPRCVRKSGACLAVACFSRVCRAGRTRLFVGVQEGTGGG